MYTTVHDSLLIARNNAEMFIIGNVLSLMVITFVVVLLSRFVSKQRKKHG